MHSSDKVKEVFALAQAGASHAEIARRTGVSRAQIRDWLRKGIDAVLTSPMRTTRNQESHDSAECEVMIDVPFGPYAYLLGQYLGDGCISTYRKGNPKLRISTCDAYPMIRQECIDAIRAVSPTVAVCVNARVGCAEVGASWRHWPCLFPQHGKGLKHSRAIELAEWQRRMALDIRPDQLVRGLIHSDGWRGWNRVCVRGRRYQYLRYLFANESTDIRWLFIEACERLGVEARHNRRNSVSVARRDSVAILERIVGPKT